LASEISEFQKLVARPSRRLPCDWKGFCGSASRANQFDPVQQFALPSSIRIQDPICAHASAWAVSLPLTT
jgi:hypothetical protein